MTTQKFIIPLKPISWNVLLRKHYWTVKKVFDEWKKATRWAVKEGKVRAVSVYPVQIMVEAHWKQKRVHDIDGLVFKPILDALVNCGILKADNLNHVAEVVHRGKIGQEQDQLIITIIENYDTRTNG